LNTVKKKNTEASIFNYPYKYAEKEGGEWKSWPCDKVTGRSIIPKNFNDLLTLRDKRSVPMIVDNFIDRLVLTVHSILFRDNFKAELRWDCVSGFPYDFKPIQHKRAFADNISDGSTADYYKVPIKATELQHLISHKNMNAQIGEIFRACYRYGEVSHSNRMRDAKKIKFYAEAEIERLEKLV